jgi:hypothetical protein
MPATIITYATKVALLTGGVRINQVWADDMNEIKSAVNNHASLIDTLSSNKANLADPAFSGNPTAPTKATSDNSPSIATTAFVKNVFAENPGPPGPSSQSYQRNQNNITFTNVAGDFFGTAAAPRTGLLTIDDTNAVLGGNVCIFYNNSSLEITPSVNLILGDFIPNELNVIFILRASNGFLIANIVNEGLLISATAPTITVTDPVFDPDAPAATAPTITVTNP